MKMDAVSFLVSACAVALSGFSLWIGTRHERSAEQRSRMPVLVFQYDGRRGWLLRNVGNGPALNVVVACKLVEGPERGKWFRAVRVPPLSRDGEMLLAWLKHEGKHGLGATYEDFLGRGQGGRAYTTTCGNDLSDVVEGSLFKFAENDITAEWGVSQRGPSSD